MHVWAACMLKSATYVARLIKYAPARYTAQCNIRCSWFKQNLFNQSPFGLQGTSPLRKRAQIDDPTKSAATTAKRKKQKRHAEVIEGEADPAPQAPPTKVCNATF